MLKHVLVGSTAQGNVFITIRYFNKRLSLTGVEGPYSNGNASGSCGQIRDTLGRLTAPRFTKETLDQLKQIWDRWHLNDMKAGTPAQEDYLRENYKERYDYTKASEVLREAGLNPDNGYKYGSAWLFEEVPEDVINFLASFPDTDLLPQIWRK
jgi:hypothetical protein